MADIQIESIVWLTLDFLAFPPAVEHDLGPDTIDAGPPAAGEVPPYVYRGRVEPGPDDTVILFAQIELNQQVTDLRLNAELGVRFRFEDAAAYTEGAVRSTLMWMAYPYVREMVSTVTARSPHDAYYLPPLTKMPDPATVEGAAPAGGGNAG